MGRLAERVAGPGPRTVLACYWRHDVCGWPMDGLEVHHILANQIGRPSFFLSDLVFLLDIFSVDQGSVKWRPSDYR